MNRKNWRLWKSEKTWRSGIEAAVAAGIVAGDERKMLECIACVDCADRENIRDYLAKNIITVELCESELAFDCTVTVEAEGESALIRIANAHTNIVHREKNGKVISDTPVTCESEDGMSSHECLTVENIIRKQKTDTAYVCTVSVRIMPFSLRAVPHRECGNADV